MYYKTQIYSYVNNCIPLTPQQTNKENKPTAKLKQLNFAALAVKVIKNYNLELDVCIMAWYLENNVYTYNVKNCCYVR